MAEPLSRREPGPVLVAFFAFVLVVGVPVRRAAADGAFPDALNILTPPDLPSEILLPTNFGVVLSHDGGSTWVWTCEQDGNLMGWLYQISPAPRHRVFTLSNQRLAYSDDLTCGWHIAGGGLVGQEVSDAWIDRSWPDRVLAVGVRCCEGGDNTYSLFESRDGGTLFGPPLYVAPVGDIISGVETTPADPETIYMTMSVGRTYQPMVARSSDGGATWELHDLGSSLGRGYLRLIAVDGEDPAKIFLLWDDPAIGEAVAVSEDGGRTATIRLPTSTNGEVMKAFVRTATGALLVATDINTAPRLYRSRDGGTTFQEVAGAPHIRGLSQRGPLVYAATDNFADGYALGISRDDGTTWSPLMSYNQVRGIAACVKSTCRSMCELLPPDLWSLDVCSADTGLPHGSADGSPDHPPASPPGRAGGGCGCSLSAAPGRRSSLPVALALALAAGLMRRRRATNLGPQTPEMIRSLERPLDLGKEHRNVEGRRTHVHGNPGRRRSPPALPRTQG